MRALPLWPTYAGLVIENVKQYETRGRPIGTLVGERIVIHATLTEPVIPDLAAAIAGRRLRRPLAYGALIGTVKVVNMERMTPVFCRWMLEHHPQEYEVGDYQPGRYAFKLAEPRPFPRPVKWKGSQGVFMVPDDVVRTAECERCSGLGTVTMPTGCIKPCSECRDGMPDVIVGGPPTRTLP